MNSHRFPGRIRFGALLPLIGVLAQAEVVPKLIVGPDQFEFVSGAYYISQGGTNAVITVRFTPGNPSWSGAVDYSTTLGTAITNQDYKPVKGTLYFSGAYASFSVPIAGNSQDPPNKTIGLILAPNPGDAGAVILRRSATLYIYVPPPPNLDISAGPNGTVSISWMDDGTGPLLEKSNGPGSTWTLVTAWPAAVSGRMTVTEPASASMTLYRLHRPQ
jgi:hypothetical protein